jgi:23S rRNA (guanosine2251-2'-O)-methyltransferase
LKTRPPDRSGGQANRPPKPDNRSGKSGDQRGPRDGKPSGDRRSAPGGGPRRDDHSPRKSLVLGDDGRRSDSGSRSDADERTLAPGHEIIYGRNGVTETLKGKRDIYAVMIADGVRLDDRMRRVQALAATRRVPVDFVPRQLLDELTPGNHQGVIAETGPFTYSELDDIRDNPGTVLVFDHLKDPQNLGTLIRTAAAAGASGIIIPENRAAEVTPAVVNASAGAVELIPVAVVANLNNAVKALKARGWWAAALDTSDDAIDIQQGDIPDPLVLIIGSEGDGISPLLRKNCDLILSIPMVGSVESLNAATAGSIAVYELLRRQRATHIDQQ